MAAINRVFHLFFYCHRLPERSFWFLGRPLFICARCTGILLGYLAGIAILVAGVKPMLWLSIALSIPLVIDGFGQRQGRWTSTNLRRLVTGLLFGSAMVFVIVWISQTGYAHGIIFREMIKGR